MKEIPLTGGYVAKVDDCDVHLVEEYKWRLHTGNGENHYAQATVGTRKTGYRNIYMHRLIAGLVEGDSRVVDHLDHDGLNNQRSNLRVCTSTQNQSNPARVSRGASAYRGVSWQAGKWTVKVRCRGSQHYVGRFSSEVEAAWAYDAKAVELFGEHAAVNFPGARSKEHRIAELTSRINDMQAEIDRLRSPLGCDEAIPA